MVDDDDADKIPDEADVEEFLGDAEEEDELDPDLKDPIDEFGAGGDEDLKTRDWE